jgi:integrase
MGVKVRDDPPGSGVWFIFVNHKGKRFAKRVGRDKRVANQIAKEVERQLASGDLGLLPKNEPKVPTFAVYSAGYLKKAVHTLKYSTWKDYDGNVRTYLSPAIGPLPIDQITRARVKSLVFELRSKNGRQGKRLKPKTVRKIIATLSAVLSDAVDDGLLSGNPAIQLKKVYRSDAFKDGATNRDINPLTREELAHLLETAETHAITRKDEVVYPYRSHRLFLLLLARTGLRLGEALALKWDAIDLHGGFLEVRRNWVRGRMTTPKNHKARRVDLSDQLRAALVQARQERFGKVVALTPDLQAERDAAAGVADTWLFPAPERSRKKDAPPVVRKLKPMDADNFRDRVWEPLLNVAKLRTVRLHDLRHTYASLLLQDGTELLYVSQQLGHHSAAFTLQVYGHLLPRDRRGEVNRLDLPASFRKPGASDSSKDVPAEKETARNSSESQAV